MRRFCRKCLATTDLLTQEVCPVCAGELLPLFDAGGALGREYLLARGDCCGSGCRNCPYDESRTTDSGDYCRNKTCPKCGAQFECRSAGCWCDNVSLDPATLEQLEKSFRGCLCPSCLTSFATA